MLANIVYFHTLPFSQLAQSQHVASDILLPGIYSGLKTIFDGWYLVDPLALFDEAGLEGINRHFREMVNDTDMSERHHHSQFP
jgi:hypothetical protein